MLENIIEQFENKQKQIQEKYGIELLKGIPHRSAALFMLQSTMRRIPQNLIFEDEIIELSKLDNYMNSPIVSSNINNFQERFIKNRQIEIVLKPCRNGGVFHFTSLFRLYITKTGI